MIFFEKQWIQSIWIEGDIGIHKIAMSIELWELINSMNFKQYAHTAHSSFFKPIQNFNSNFLAHEMQMQIFSLISIDNNNYH